MGIPIHVPYAYPLNGNGRLVGESPNLVHGDNNDYNCNVNLCVEVDTLFDSYLEVLIASKILKQTNKQTLMMREAH